MLTFSTALNAMKKGFRVYREPWEGTKWIAIQRPDCKSKMTQPYIFMEYEHGDRYPWTPSQIDILFNDWQIHADDIRAHADKQAASQNPRGGDWN